MLSIATKNQPFSQVGWGGCDSLIATISLSDYSWTLDSNFKKRLAVDLLASTTRLDSRDLHSRLPKFNPDHYPQASQDSKPTSRQCSCLWQPCNRSFTPSHPAQVFCSEECRLNASTSERLQRRTESTRKANQTYR